MNYTDVAGLAETSYELRAIVFVWRVGFGLNYEQFDDSEQYTGFVRFNF